MFSRDIHALIPRNCEHVTLHGKGDFADVTKVKDLKIERLSWNIQVCPVYSHETLKAENFDRSQRHVMKGEVRAV